MAFKRVKGALTRLRIFKRRVDTASFATTDSGNASAPDTPFQMRGCRELLNDYSDSLQIMSSIQVVERSIPNDPGIAFTHCRGLLETVCKTILTDRGVSIEPDANSNQVMAATLKVMKLTPADFDADDRVETGVVDLIRGLNQMTNGVVALRNSQGLGPHGRDALDAILDAEYAIVTAHAIDAAASLLYRIHRKQSERYPLKRIRYGDYSDFDAFLDDKYPDIEIEEAPIQASHALCLLEPEAYRQSLVAFIASPDKDDSLEFSEGEVIAEDADG